MTNLDVYYKIAMLPDSMKQEVSDFVDSLKNKTQHDTKKPFRRAGLAKGLISMRKDFDDPFIA